MNYKIGWGDQRSASLISDVETSKTGILHPIKYLPRQPDNVEAVRFKGNNNDNL